MKRKRDFLVYLRDILDYSAKAQRFVDSINYDQFIENEEKLFAVIYALEVIGEAANHLPRSLTNRYPAIPWSSIVGMRNFVIHGYDLVDPEVVWKTVKVDLPPLDTQISEILAELA